MYKRIRFTLLGVFAALCAGCAALPVSEDYTGAANATNAVAATSGQNVRECRWAKATGTKMRSRICHSQEEWAQIDAATAAPQNTDEFFRRQRENSTLTGNVAVPAARGGPGL